jgi:hypothetical protein
MLCKMESLTFDGSKHNRMHKNTRSKLIILKIYLFIIWYSQLLP